MSDLHYQQFVWADFFADTMHMTGNAAKAYLFLIGNAWIRGAKLPDDNGVLARCARCTPREWASIKDEVMALWFKDENGDWTQKRLRADFEKMLTRVDANRKNGALGGRPTSGKKPKEINETANPRVLFGLHNLESESEVRVSLPLEEPKPREEKRGGDSSDDWLKFEQGYPWGELMSRPKARALFDALPQCDQQAAVAALPRFREAAAKAKTTRPTGAERFLRDRLFDNFAPAAAAAAPSNRKVFVEADTPAFRAHVKAGHKASLNFATGEVKGRKTKGYYFQSEWPPGFVPPPPFVAPATSPPVLH